MSPRTKATICNILGMLFCVVPATVATLEHFPIWISRGGEVFLSGFSLVLLLLCALPFKRQITEYLRSPSAWFVWLCIFAFSVMFSRIINDIAAISLVAFVTNFIGAFLFKLRDEYKKKE